MRHHIVLSLALGLMAAGTSKADEVLKSPDGDIALTFEIRDGRPTLSLIHISEPTRR